MKKKIHFAPVQGHTDAAYRHLHASRYEGVDYYYTPFIRLEKGEVRHRDLRDTFGKLSEATPAIPQLIFRDEEELSTLVAKMKSEGAKVIDINMGCPFPLQTSKGRGAATVASEKCHAAVKKIVSENPDIEFSVKMRLGYADPTEWRELIPVLNELKLTHIAVHPRVAKQQYGGDLYLDEMKELIKESANPVVFNGEIKTPEDAQRVIENFPEVSGLMIGRGLLARPSLAEEITSGSIWSIEKRLDAMLRFHRVLMRHYEDTLCGEHQVLSKLIPFWEYAEAEIGRKAWKQIKKASNMAKYHSAVAIIGN